MLDRGPAGHWTKVKIGTGNQEAKPFKGASEVKVGRLRESLGLRGHDRALARSPGRGVSAQDVVGRFGGGRAPGRASGRARWSPSRCQWGHAVWCADLDGDGDDELLIGQRDPNRAGSIGPRGPGVYRLRPQTKLPSRSPSNAIPLTREAWLARMPWPPTWTATAGWTSLPEAGPPITSGSTGIAVDDR